MQSDPFLNQLFSGNESSYLVEAPYPEVVGFIRYYAGELSLPLENDLLVIEIPEGVFVHTTQPAWIDFMNGMSTSKERPFPIQQLKPGKWKETTRKYRAPLQSFGDEKLVMWKVGF